MKIRTDFVTNSSSYSSAEIVVDNPILLEILQRYKDKGLFDDKKIYFTIDGSFRFYTPDGNFDADSIDSLQACLEGIIQLMTSQLDGLGCVYDEDLYKQMVEELHEKEVEILKGYEEVYWYVDESSNEEYHDDKIYKGNVITEEKFIFNAQNGEEFNYSQTGEPYGNDEEPFIEKIHRLNGKDIK